MDKIQGRGSHALGTPIENSECLITEADPHCIGSIAIDRALMDRVGIWAGERVLVVSNDSDERLETYVIPDDPGSGVIGINGAAALCMRAGEQIIIMGFELSETPIEPTIVLVDERNQFECELQTSSRDPVGAPLFI